MAPSSGDLAYRHRGGQLSIYQSSDRDQTGVGCYMNTFFFSKLPAVLQIVDVEAVCVYFVVLFSFWDTVFISSSGQFGHCGVAPCSKSFDLLTVTWSPIWGKKLSRILDVYFSCID